jgi:hypothetical protein
MNHLFAPEVVRGSHMRAIGAARTQITTRKPVMRRVEPAASQGAQNALWRPHNLDLLTLYKHLRPRDSA